MIRICMVVHNYYSRDTRVRRYVSALTKAGAHVDVLCLREENQAPSSQNGPIRVFPIPLSHTSVNAIRYPLEYGAALLLFAARLVRLQIANRYNIIHVHNMPDFLVFAAAAPKILGAKVILDIHDPMPEVYISKFRAQGNTAAVRLVRLQEKLSCMFADSVVTANSSFKANLIGRGVSADKITVVNNFPDLDVFNRARYQSTPVRRQERFTLIYPGTLAARFRALPRLVTDIPQLRLLIIARQTEYVSHLSELAKQLGVASNVEFKPPVPPEEIPAQLVAADIGVYAGRSDPHMDIATPTKVLEYAVMGIPIIASRFRVLEDLFSESEVMFFESGNVDEFAACVLELFLNASKRNELVRNADNGFVSRSPWDNERRVYFELLNHLLPAGEKRLPASTDKRIAQ